MSLRVTEGGKGLRLEVKVQPRASRNQILGEWEGALKVKLTAPPLEGEANRALLAFLADEMQVPRRSLQIITGESSRHKLVEITGLKKEELLQRLQQLGISMNN